MRQRPVLAASAAALVALGCGESPVVAPRSIAAGAALATALGVGEAASTLDLAGAAADARTRVVPTVTDAAARAALDASLGALDLSLAGVDAVRALDAVAASRRTLDAVLASGSVAPADGSAIELALDRVSARLAPAAAASGPVVP